jgi:hypothetical protein
MKQCRRQDKTVGNWEQCLRGILDDTCLYALKWLQEDAWKIVSVTTKEACIAGKAKTLHYMDHSYIPNVTFTAKYGIGNYYTVVVKWPDEELYKEKGLIAYRGLVKTIFLPNGTHDFHIGSTTIVYF